MPHALQADDPGRYAHLIASDTPDPARSVAIKAERADLLQRRMAWLRADGYR